MLAFAIPIILASAGLAYFFGKTGAFFGLILGGAYFWKTPGRGLRSKLDRFAMLDGAWMAGHWRMCPHRRFYRKNIWSLLLGIWVIGIYVWRGDASRLEQTITPRVDTTEPSLSQQLAELGKDATIGNHDPESQLSSKLDAAKWSRVPASQQNGEGQRVLSDGPVYDWLRQRPFRLE